MVDLLCDNVSIQMWCRLDNCECIGTLAIRKQGNWSKCRSSIPHECIQNKSYEDSTMEDQDSTQINGENFKTWKNLYISVQHLWTTTLHINPLGSQRSWTVSAITRQLIELFEPCKDAENLLVSIEEKLGSFVFEAFRGLCHNRGRFRFFMIDLALSLNR